MKNVMDALKSMMGEGKKSEPAETAAEAREENRAEEPAALPEEGRLTVKAEYVGGESGPSQKEILKACVLEYLDAHKFKYQVAADSDRMFHASLNIRLNGQLNTCRLIIFVTGSDIESIAVSPINTAEEHRAAVAEYMLRVNYGLKLGAFELDFRDGEVRFKSTLSALEGRPSSADVARVVSMPVIMMDQFGEGLVKCMLGVGNPAEEAEKTRKK